MMTTNVLCQQRLLTYAASEWHERRSSLARSDVLKMQLDTAKVRSKHLATCAYHGARVHGVCFQALLQVEHPTASSGPGARPMSLSYCVR
jgi:hypothetical protein